MGSWRGEKERNIGEKNVEIAGKRRKEGRGERVDIRESGGRYRKREVV